MLRRLAAVGQNRYVVAVVTGSLAGFVLLVFFLLVRGQRDTIILQVQPVEDPLLVKVYVGGEVANPGLYSLRRGSRVADAIVMAGGSLLSGDTSAIGMAAALEDSDQIIVPARRPTPQATVHSDSAPPPDATTVSPYQTPTMPQPTEIAGPINVNTATAVELDELPGIGPAIAGRIVEYRVQHGPFQSLEELELVSGISLRMVDELRPLITLGS